MLLLTFFCIFFVLSLSLNQVFAKLSHQYSLVLQNLTKTLTYLRWKGIVPVLFIYKRHKSETRKEKNKCKLDHEDKIVKDCCMHYAESASMM